MPNSKYIVEQDGYVSLNVVHGANYVLLPSQVKFSESVWMSKQIKVTKGFYLGVGEKRFIVVKLPNTVTKLSSLEDYDSTRTMLH